MKYYDYENLLYDVKSVKDSKQWKSPVKCIEIGCSVLLRPIFAFFVGTGNAAALICGGMHAREHIGSAMISYLMHNFESADSSFIFIPMTNPDGVELSLHGLDSVELYGRYSNLICQSFNNNYYEKYNLDSADFMRKSAYKNYILNDKTPVNERKKLLFFINGSNDFSMWKANANAVDLNVNWDANFSAGASNINFPSPENFIGKYPFSEIENRILKELIVKNDLKAVISYHSKGNTVYWDYENRNNYQIEAEKTAEILGYELKKAEKSHGGLKDWFIQKYNRLGLTIELGDDRYNYLEQYEHIDECKEKHLILMNYLRDLVI